MISVRVEFVGRPFSRRAVMHALRHAALRHGWRLDPAGVRRLVFATVASGDDVTFGPGDVCVLSHPGVAAFFSGPAVPVPLGPDGLAFPHPAPGALAGRPEVVPGDICAGALAVMNLWYEWKSRPEAEDGWIRFADDWWPRAGFSRPEPVADRWLDALGAAAHAAGWPVAEPGPATVLLTHDVDYLPTRLNRGLPRALRAMARQVVLRRRPLDALRVLGAYLVALPVCLPYDDVAATCALEARHGARSCYQFVAGGGHPSDPAYRVDALEGHRALAAVERAGAEVCLHGSYLASRTPGALARERAALEAACGRAVRGHRQHYLNFHPAPLFREVEAAGLDYDMSVGFNDATGPRAGTLRPYVPYDLERDRPFGFWEIPFTLMDTTLASFMRLPVGRARELALAELDRVLDARGAIGLIWHQEQCGGLLDPGYHRVYADMLAHLRVRGAHCPTGSTMADGLWAAWKGAARQ